MAVAHHTAVSRWADRAHTSAPDHALSMTGHNVFAEGDRIYSYGHHFEMARILRERDGVPFAILINGDRYSVTTSQHQGMVRSAAQRTGLSNIIVPFSALSAAGVELDSVRPIHVQDDTYTYTPRVLTTEQMNEHYRFELTADGSYVDRYTHGGPDPEQVDVHHWRVYDERHWLGEALLTGKVHDTYERAATDAEIAQYQRWIAYARHRRELEAAKDSDARALSEACEAIRDFYGHGREAFASALDRAPANVREDFEKIEAQRNASYHLWTQAAYSRNAPERPNVHERHARGGMRYEVTVRRTRTAKFLSAFDHNEAREVYFLCELPRQNGNAQTVDEAFEALKPQAVKDALASGLHVERQGDIFAIPTSLTTKELKSRAKLQERFEYAEHVTTENGVHGVAERTVMLPERTMVAIVKRGVLLTTNHTASEVIYTKDGDTYARGVLRHEPGRWRGPDHARRKMGDGKTWYRILRNTVPLAKDRRSTGAAPQSGQSRAWTLGGSVD